MERERNRIFATNKIVAIERDLDQTTYYVYGVDSVTTVKAYCFDIIDGVLLFKSKNNKVVRVFASGVWKQFVPEGENNDTGY